MNIKTDNRRAGLAGVLLIVTTCAVLAQTLSKTTVLDLHQLSPGQVMAVDDRYEGGKSIASVSLPKTEQDPLVLTCEIVVSDVSWPYCSVSMNFTKGMQGLDLSNYEHFLLWVKYEKNPTQGIRFQVRNFNSSYSKIGDDFSLKYNTVEFTNAVNPYPIKVPLQSFQVPTWWLTSKKLTHIDGVPEFDNIHTIDIVTGYVMPPGHYTINIENIAVVGKWVNADTLYLSLLIVWVLVGLFYLLSHLKLFSKKKNRDSEIAALKELIERKSRLEKPIAAIDPQSGRADSYSLANLLYAFYQNKKNNDLTVLMVECDRVQMISIEQRETLLQECAHTIASNTRNSDTVARWGDSGFVIVCPFTDLAYASQLAEKIRVMIEDMALEQPVTVSIGVAALAETQPQGLVEQAENAVKSAQFQGGNCVACATPHAADIQVETYDI